METVFKLAITAVVLCAVYYQLVLIRTVWRSQIDPRATITRLLKKLEPENTLIATRDPEKRVTFKQLSNTTELRADQPFDYQRSTFKIISIASRIGMVVDMNETGSRQARDVLGDVVREKIH